MGVLSSIARNATEADESSDDDNLNCDYEVDIENPGAIPPPVPLPVVYDRKSTGDLSEEVQSQRSYYQSKQSSNNQDDDVMKHMDVLKMKRRTLFFVTGVILLSMIASFIFIWFGIKNEELKASESFDTRANELTLVVQTTWNEYQRVAASAHEICSRGGGNTTTRLEFQEFYEYLLADGIEFQSIQCVPNVTHAERPQHEAEAKVYWENRIPGFEYTGFVGVLFDKDTGEVTGVEVPESIQEYYFPIKYCEPPEGNLPAIDLDVYIDKGTFAPMLNKAIETMQPVLSGRIETIQETTTKAYSVLVYHPGVPLSTRPNDWSNVFSSLVVRILTLLERVAQLQQEDLAVYLYDIRPDGRKEFLGAAEYDVHTTDAEESDGDVITTSVTFPQEISYDDLKEQADPTRFHEEIIPIASGSWSVVVLPVDTTYESDTSLVIFGGVMLFVAGIGIAIWSCTNNKRIIEVYEAKAKQAAAERAIVANLFPENVRNRLLEEANNHQQDDNNAKDKSNKKGGSSGISSGAYRNSSSMSNGNNPSNNKIMISNHKNKSGEFSSEGLFGSKPIADFHPEATLMFADLQGFTAWSSTREPTQVFTLLEVLYNAFDRIASRRRIFKVETVGDCYVASAGVPVARSDHAIAMAKFACDCLRAMPMLLAQLEKSLGPETADLAIRVGLHSGAVTSGVLRGDKGRFQLFGDAMNSASRMESTGVAGRIHVSPQCAELIRRAGKGNWLEPRDVQVFVKGKGRLQTYWLNNNTADGTKTETASQVSNAETLSQGESIQLGSKEFCSISVHKTNRLVGWAVEEMSRLLKLVVARRQACDDGDSSSRTTKDSTTTVSSSEESLTLAQPLDEVKDVISFPKFDAKAYGNQVEPETIVLDPAVVSQLTEFISHIADMYNSNPFHSFEHAAHVGLSVSKLLSRIVQQNNPRGGVVDDTAAFELHDHTFGITSAPITQFCAFLCALIHDVDHPGIPNSAFAKEKPDLAKIYKNTSIAEQNSIDMSWALFMRDDYKDLRKCICSTNQELIQFRQLIVQMVMATDVMDKEIGKLRKERWNKAFDTSSDEELDDDDDDDFDVNGESDETIEIRDRKATIVLEHLIQASDVSHTMQHWHVYYKWNEKLFMEMYHAYKQGRLEDDPSVGWYKGEIGFLDFYVIPLAKKLDTCGVFGVSSDEFLIYATANREEWIRRGEEIVQLYLEKYNSTFVGGS